MSKRKASLIEDKMVEATEPPKRSTRVRESRAADLPDETLTITARKKRAAPVEPEPTPMMTTKKLRRRESVEPPTPSTEAPKKKLGRPPKKRVEEEDEENHVAVIEAPLKTPAKTGKRPKAVPTTPR